MWDPAVYGRYAGERARPFFELLARVRAENPRFVVDLGCGPGELTAELRRRWPEAYVHGIDSSPAMIAKAPPGPTFSVGDVRDWRPDHPIDVIISNALLQWIPEHRDLLPRWLGHLAPGGWLAFQVPGNFDAPSHAAVRRLCASPAWAGRLGDLSRYDPVDGPEGYLDLLAGLGCEVDAWETTYVHVLPGEDAVLAWISGTALRPMLDRLSGDDAAREAFLADCARVLAEAYPRRPYGTPFPFRRVFVVARGPGREGS
ncbi:trans-aconitate 2-methyltransferase [Sphaerisporangium krabiense]|uniref:Trans-aconitate 2-methyltransferase n=1 Tax=Sphaerisporangium krabiense TaxID=763782 RepID=A0A7W8Z4D6_9ACTN|nr:trans-aconitate 2-methyltransferase [Sphaerisporangium krabiense]MBB5627241.1 trans-aconitate 2-methyltransferase [Sphaerisporangium krabiense]GII64626.1 trans-aconitate 2-methyltransferase [Sphaerisporangium krabiense]